MTPTQMRNDIVKRYSINEHGIITDCGKFQSEMLYVPYYWDLCLSGMFAEDVAGVFFLPFDKDDYALWPDLDGKYGIALRESEQGFVLGEVFSTQAEYNAAVERCEKIEDSE